MNIFGKELKIPKIKRLDSVSVIDNNRPTYIEFDYFSKCFEELVIIRFVIINLISEKQFNAIYCAWAQRRGRAEIGKKTGK